MNETLNETLNEASTEAAIELENVVVTFGDVRAVDGISLRVERGELLMLLGGSGSGKTTALKTINRLIEPSSGTVTVGGENVRNVAPELLRRGIGYHFQGVGLFPHFTVAENIGITPKLLEWPAKKIEARVDTLLTMVELEAKRFRDRLPSELSGGQRQRVGVARALAAEPDVVLFDEPFGALDPMTREQLQRELRALQKKLGWSGVFVTHDVIEAITLGDRIGVMRDGRLLQIGTPAELREAPVDDEVARLMHTPERLLASLSSDSDEGEEE